MARIKDTFVQEYTNMIYDTNLKLFNTFSLRIQIQQLRKSLIYFLLNFGVLVPGFNPQSANHNRSSRPFLLFLFFSQNKG